MSAFAGDLCEQFRSSNRFAENEVSVRAGADTWFPSRDDADPHRRPLLTGKGRKVPTTSIRQPDVRHEHFVRRIRLLQQLHRFGDTHRGVHPMSIRLEQRLHELAAVGMIFYQEDVSRNPFGRYWLGDLRHSLMGRLREYKPNRRSDARHQLNLDMTAMPLHDTVPLSQAESGSHPCLGGKEGFECALPHL